MTTTTAFLPHSSPHLCPSSGEGGQTKRPAIGNPPVHSCLREELIDGLKATQEVKLNLPLSGTQPWYTRVYLWEGLTDRLKERQEAKLSVQL